MNKLSIINTKYIILFTILIFPIEFLSFDIVNITFRDNTNYKLFFDNAFGRESIAESYSLFFAATGGREPVSFLYLYVLSAFGFSYTSAIMLKNYAISILLYIASVRISDNVKYLILIFAYISTDYYLLRLFSELHRLSLASLFVLAGFLFKNRSRAALLLTAAMSHLQVILCAPVALYKISNIKYIMLLVLLSSLIFELGRRKLNIYLDYHPYETIEIILYFLPFLYFMINIDREALRLWLFATATLSIACFLFGIDRILVMYWELMIFTLFYYVGSGKMDVRLSRQFFVFIIFMVVPYNAYRLYVEYIYIFDAYGGPLVR